MPYMVGWHPGFILWGEDKINDFRVEFCADEKKELPWYPITPGQPIPEFPITHALDHNCYYLNEEEIYANDTMIFSSVPTSVRLSAGGKYALDMSWSENTPYLCIWKEPSHDAAFICLEPWSGLPQDGITPECFDVRPMRRIKKDESEIFRTSYKFTV